MERARRTAATPAAALPGPAAIGGLDNDGLIIRLHFTINHLSRWLSPVHEQGRLERSVYRDQPSTKELVLRLRDEELIVFPMLHAIATKTSPDLDKLPPPRRLAEEQRHERGAPALEVMAEFRRLRQSTCSLLRSLPDDAWDRIGISRRDHDWTIRTLAERLALHDVSVLAAMDRSLDLVGVRDGIAAVSRVPLAELERLDPLPED